MSDARPQAAAPDQGLEEKVRVLRRKATYPDAPSTVTAVETHMSWVFLTDHYVYKLKKPVRYEFLDFSTLEHRRRDCQREVQLNRRLAADVYLGTVALTRAPDGLRLGGEGPVVEWLVKMRRLPDELMLDEAIERDAVGEAEIRRVARLLADFYSRASPVSMGGSEYRARLERATMENRDELRDPVHGLSPTVIEHIVQDQLDILRGRPELFDQRVREKRVVEAHGDLRPQHICLTDPPVIIDCLEFNRDFRLLDPVDELAYLAVECDRLGAPAVGQQIMAECLESLGDTPPEELVAYYKSLRACLRAKLAAMHTRDDKVRNHPEWLKRVRIYLDLAQSYIPHRK